MTEPIRVYRIRHTETGLYSGGGANVNTNPRGWNTRGKFWNKPGDLKLHLGMYSPEDYEKWEIEVFTLDHPGTIPASELMAPPPCIYPKCEVQDGYAKLSSAPCVSFVGCSEGYYRDLGRMKRREKSQ